MAAFGSQPAQPVAQADYKVPNSPADGISSLSLSVNSLLVSTSFDNSVRCWQIQKQMNQVQANAVAEVKADGPVLCSDFNHDGSVCFFGGADNQAKMWQLGQPTAQTIGRHEKPIKCIQYVQIQNNSLVITGGWDNTVGSVCFFGGADNQAKMWQLGQPTAQTIGRHEKPIKCIQYVQIQNNSLVITGGWDNTVKFWDMRQPNPVQSISVAQRVYAMGVRSPLMVVATADVPAHERQPNSAELRYVYTFNLQNFQHGQPHSFDPSPLKHQTRCIATFPDQTGYAIGSIEGRVAIQHVDQAKKDKNFAFKCHRQQGQQLVQGKQTSEVYAVNAITFHPLGTFATAGSDGVFNFWDKDSKQRLKNFPRCNGPISAAKFSPAGDLFAYSVSYDWSKGREFYNQAAPNDIFLHVVEQQEVQPRPMKGGKGRGR
eukprot:CAMPEP_0205946866 /NCGR_PEP_ID=MMETSP1325-20131115/69266_1 /ASSEMBLY_ACC=CAM_ASM_000708 /TAXON_ID=236786 /ORGANISM="Florenciella sp., Strain RCC1007" /LENGTH=428 /DNA_ID=CAMNT_0053317953 /DNA_START=202 /DNA_END=1488 /DNA_ORIENTATION=-